ncbi:MAG: hypothetical protein KDB14_18440 [Planctomycetales bacterium]|nr:hypothetical protein [Planctomycetales bacterium]
MSLRLFAVVLIAIVTIESHSAGQEFVWWEPVENARFTSTTSMQGVALTIEASNFYRFQAHEEKGSTYILAPLQWKATHAGDLQFEVLTQKVAHDPGYRFSYLHKYHFEHLESCQVDLAKLPDSPVWKTGLEIVITDLTRSGGPISYVVQHYAHHSNDDLRINPYMDLKFTHRSFWERTGLEASIDGSGAIVVEPVEPTGESNYRQFPMLEIGCGRPLAPRDFLMGQTPSWHGNYDPHRRYLPRLDWKRIDATGRFSIPVTQRESRSSTGGLGSVSFDTSWKLEIGDPSPRPTLEPVDADERKWLPKPGDKRKYRLTLDDPGRYEAIRFRLEDVSEHPGIACNAGNHARYKGMCLDCKCGDKQVEIAVRTQFDGRKFPRFYRKYGDCPLDAAPDLFFDTFFHDEYEAGGKRFSEDLHTEKCTQLTLEHPRQKVYEVAVDVMDYAASGMLFADVKVGGEWRPALSQGDTARGDGLQIPLDADKNELPDAWQDEYNSATDATADIDRTPAGDHPGDGLTNFEEFRGVFARGQHQRLHPDEKDAFAHAYQQTDYDAHLGYVAKCYAAQKLHLHPLDAGEFEGEVVNYNTSDELRRARQYITIIEDATTMTGRGFPMLHLEEGIDASWAGKAPLGPPRRYENTLVLKFGGSKMLRTVYELRGEPLVEANAWAVLGHELGHQLGIRHHGELDREFTVEQLKAEGVNLSEPPERSVAVAFQGGQHSGDPKCFMCYRSAIIRQDAKGNFQLWNRPTGNRAYFCTDSRAQDYNKQHGVGDATLGRCLQQIKLATPNDEAPEMNRREIAGK